MIFHSSNCYLLKIPKYFHLFLAEKKKINYKLIKNLLKKYDIWCILHAYLTANINRWVKTFRLFARIVQYITHYVDKFMNSVIDSVFEMVTKYAWQSDIIIAFLVWLHRSCIILFMTLWLSAWCAVDIAPIILIQRRIRHAGMLSQISTLLCMSEVRVIYFNPVRHYQSILKLFQII